MSNQFVQTSTLVAPASLARALPFDPTLRKGQDLDLCIRWAAEGVKFTMLPDPLTVWVDQSEANRTSRHGGWKAPESWLAKAEPWLSTRAIRGYRATVLAYYMSGEKPLTALRYIMAGWLRAGVPFKITARQLARSFIPRKAYRRMVNTYVAMRGR